MSEEEKKAVEYWKRDIVLYHWNTQLASEHYAQIILNLIEKQQKELNNLKDKIKEKLELLKDILKAKEKDGNIYKQIPIEYLKGAIEQLEELLLEEK